MSIKISNRDATKMMHESTHACSIGDGWYTLYNLEDCDVCGEDFQAANAVQLKVSRERLVAAGIEVVDEMHEELAGYCDAAEGAVCSACYID